MDATGGGMTDQELMEYAADHLAYDLWMLGEIASWLRQAHEGPEGAFVIKNAMLESFTIHVRALAHFLYYEAKSDDAVTAEHYVKDIQVWAIGARPNAERTRCRGSTHK